MSYFFRCPHCKEPIFDSTEKLHWLTLCDFCKNEFDPGWDSEYPTWLPRTEANSRQSICKNCIEAVDVAIAATLASRKIDPAVIPTDARQGPK